MRVHARHTPARPPSHFMLASRFESRQREMPGAQGRRFRGLWDACLLEIVKLSLFCELVVLQGIRGDGEDGWFGFTVLRTLGRIARC